MSGETIGLPLAKASTEAHSGTLAPDRSPGQGTHASLALPAGPALPAATA